MRFRGYGFEWFIGAFMVALTALAATAIVHAEREQAACDRAGGVQVRVANGYWCVRVQSLERIELPR